MSRTYDYMMLKSEEQLARDTQEALAGEPGDSPLGVYQRREEARDLLDEENILNDRIQRLGDITVAQWEKWFLPVVEYHKRIIAFYVGAPKLPPKAYWEKFSEDMKRVNDSVRAADFHNKDTIEFQEEVARKLLNLLFTPQGEGWKEDVLKGYLDPVKVAVNKWHSAVKLGFDAKLKQIEFIDDPYGKNRKDGKKES